MSNYGTNLYPHDTCKGVLNHFAKITLKISFQPVSVTKILKLTQRLDARSILFLSSKLIAVTNLMNLISQRATQ